MQYQSIKDLPINDHYDTTTLARKHLDDLESVFWAIRQAQASGEDHEAIQSHIVRLVGVGEKMASEAANIFANQADILEIRGEGIQ